MRHHIRPYVVRHEPEARPLALLKSGTGAVVGMSLVGALAAFTGLPLLMAPLAATAVLLFGQASSPLAQPVNVFGGYLLATIIAVSAATLAPGLWWAAAIAIGLSIALMMALRVTHPPAGAVPLVAMGAPDHGLILFVTAFIGCASLVALAVLHHRLPPREAYPRPLAKADAVSEG